MKEWCEEIDVNISNKRDEMLTGLPVLHLEQANFVIMYYYFIILI